MRLVHAPAALDPYKSRPARKSSEKPAPWLATARCGEPHWDRLALAAGQKIDDWRERTKSGRFLLMSGFFREQTPSHTIDKKHLEQAKLSAGIYQATSLTFTLV